MTDSFPLKELGRKARGRIFSPTDTDNEEGQGPSVFKLGWFFLFSFLALGLTVAVSFSCSSAATSNLHMYSVRPAALVQGLIGPSTRAVVVNGTMKSLSNTTTTTSTDDDGDDGGDDFFSTADFGIASLPDRYLFGISGLCRHWRLNDTDETRCRHRFPQLPSLLEAILEDSESAAVDVHVRDSWTRLLTSTHISGPDQVSLWRHHVTMAAGLLVTSILWAVATIAFTLFMPKYLKYSILLEVVDAIMAITAAILWTVIFNSQSDALAAAAAPEHLTPLILKHILAGGPGLSFLWALTWSKLMVTPLMMLILLVIALFPVLCCCAALAHDPDRIRVDVHHHHDV